jgi:hypothetical protein
VPSITAERAALERVGLRLRRREAWGARFDYTTARSVSEPAAHQFVHITITNPDAYSSNDAHARAVESIGISRFPNTGISYNRLCLPGGQGYEAQPIGRRGAHTVNDDQRSTCSTAGCPSRGRSLQAPSWNLNINSRAYALARDVDDPVTSADLDTLARMIAGDRLAGFVTRDATLHGHRCCSSKSCPGDRMWGLMGNLADRVTDYLRRGNVAPEDEMELTDIVKTDSWDVGKRNFGADASLRGILVYAGGYSRDSYIAAKAIRAEQAAAKLRDTAILAAVQGSSSVAILTRIDQVAAAEVARDQAAQDQRLAILQLLQNHADGSLDADAVVRKIGELLTAEFVVEP